jgi:hypothetical protein
MHGGSVHRAYVQCGMRRPADQCASKAQERLVNARIAFPADAEPADAASKRADVASVDDPNGPVELAGRVVAAVAVRGAGDPTLRLPASRAAAATP